METLLRFAVQKFFPKEVLVVNESVDYSGFENCCGAVEIGNFTGTAKEIRASILTEIGEFKGYEADGSDSAPGLLIATTIASQKEAIKALKALKFRKVLSFVNPGTANKVTLWTLRLTY